MAEQRRLRVLILAESANPESSSVSLVGWSLSHALRDYADAHIVTHVRNREALERAGWIEGREFSAIDPAKVEGPVTRFGEGVRKATRLGLTWNTVFGTFTYYYFEELVWRRFGAALKRGEFDIVHRITPVSPATPSLIARRCQRLNVPFIWGPINGGVPWPNEFRSALRREGEWLSYVRGARKLLPAYRTTRGAAAALITGSTYVWEDMEGHHDRCVYLPENAIEPSIVAEVEPVKREGGPLRVAFAGRLTPYKGADMLVEAAAPLLRSGELVLDVIGDGPEMLPLRKQVAAAEVEKQVEFSGWIQQREVLKRLARAQVFAFPSIREFGGGVILEAMALGLTPVVVDYGGPRELVTEDSGYRVPMGNRESIVAAFRQILADLARHPDRLQELGDHGRQRVASLFTWDVKACQILEVYRWVLGQRPKPHFGMPLTNAIG